MLVRGLKDENGGVTLDAGKMNFKLKEFMMRNPGGDSPSIFQKSTQSKNRCLYTLEEVDQACRECCFNKVSEMICLTDGFLSRTKR